jgi:hypothetical protein
MDCRMARLLLEFTHPGGSELAGDPAEAAELETHLHTCPECDAAARTERRVDEHMGRAMREVSLPVGLRQRVMDRLARDRAVARRRWLVRASSVAAAFVLVALSWWVWAVVSVPGLPVDKINKDASEFQISGIDSKTVTQWFQEKYHVTTEAPGGSGEFALNYGLLVDYGLDSLQGQQVPRLLFVEGKNSARVYIVTDWQFRIKEIPDGAVFPGSGATVAVWQHPSNPHLAYVIVYSGSLEPFLLRRSGAG